MPTSRIGACHLCGETGPLSFEHVPPRKAFNNRPVIRASFKDSLGIGPDEPIRGENQQRGMGEYTLCPGCNNKTGSWYGDQFVRWCYQGYDILVRSNGNPSLVYLYHLLPLRIIKQILTMFFSINGPEFQNAHPELVKFILNREMKYLSPSYRFFIYYTISSRLRCSGVTGRLDMNTRELCIFSELSYFPFGYVMTFDSPPPDPRLLEISHFSSYGYEEFNTMTMRLPVLPTLLWFPGDYRTRDQILANRKRSEKVREDY